MSTSQFISVRESAQILSVSEKKIMELVEGGKLQAYRIADQFLRLKRDEILSLRDAGNVKIENTVLPYTAREQIFDFFYYNDFYLLAILFIIILLYYILNF